jgi:thiol:disulfide interchange protein
MPRTTGEGDRTMLHVSGPQTTDTEETPAAPRRFGTGKVAAILLLVAAASVFAAQRYVFGPSAVAAADRKAGVKPVLLMFTADWCQPCQNFKGTVLADDRVVNAVVGTCKLQMVDLTKPEGPGANVAKRYGVEAIPTLILVNSKGQEFDRYAGPHDPAAFAGWVSAHK